MQFELVASSAPEWTCPFDMWGVAPAQLAAAMVKSVTASTRTNDPASVVPPLASLPAKVLLPTTSLPATIPRAHSLAFAFLRPLRINPGHGPMQYSINHVERQRT
jgi:hypothetical protein